MSLQLTRSPNGIKNQLPSLIVLLPGRGVDFYSMFEHQTFTSYIEVLYCLVPIFSSFAVAENCTILSYGARILSTYLFSSLLLRIMGIDDSMLVGSCHPAMAPHVVVFFDLSLLYAVNSNIAHAMSVVEGFVIVLYALGISIGLFENAKFFASSIFLLP